MKALGLALVVFGFLMGARGFCQEAQGDKEKIQGTWQIVSFEGRAPKKLVSPEALKKAKVVITAEQITFDFGKEKFEASFKIDGAKKPKTIDLVDLKEKDKEPALGIYLLDGDSLKLCWNANPTSTTRPTEFSKVGKVEQDLRLFVLKREKKK